MAKKYIRNIFIYELFSCIFVTDQLARPPESKTPIKRFGQLVNERIGVLELWRTLEESTGGATQGS
jgi:hypothetical protein